MEDNIKKVFIVDSSYVLSFLLKENILIKDFFEKYINSEYTLVSTELLRYEVGNGLKSAYLAKRIKRQKAQKLYKEFFNLKISEYQPELFGVLELAFEKNLSFYDATYLRLSREKNLPLLTLDNRLKKL